MCLFLLCLSSLITNRALIITPISHSPNVHVNLLCVCHAQPVKGEEEKEGEVRTGKRVRQTDEYNQHLHKEVVTRCLLYP